MIYMYTYRLFTHMCVCIYIYISIYIYRSLPRRGGARPGGGALRDLRVSRLGQAGERSGRPLEILLSRDVFSGSPFSDPPLGDGYQNVYRNPETKLYFQKCQCFKLDTKRKKPQNEAKRSA